MSVDTVFIAVNSSSMEVIKLSSSDMLVFSENFIELFLPETVA